MSKRKSINSNTPLNNTLFNYFLKSPSSSKSKTISTEEPKTYDIERVEDHNIKDKDNEDVKIKIKTSKRRRIDSESDQENSSSETNSVTDVSKKLKTSENIILPSKKVKTDVGNSKTLFAEKLKQIQIDDAENVINVDSTEIEGDTRTWAHNKLNFLKKENIKDKNEKRADHPDYDSTTLYVPTSFLDGLTPAMRQWWMIKSEYFDCILFFKVGKFYELYHMDADIGVNELGFTYMRGEFAHSGFPEQSYDRMATSLINRGYKVARIEQTETPETMQERIKSMVKPTKFDKVVKREVCQVANTATEIFGQQVALKNEYKTNYMLAISENYADQSVRYGICFVDTSLSEFHIGEFVDDNHRSSLLTLLSHYPCALVLYERRGISTETAQIFKTILCNTPKEHLLPDSQFWSAKKTLQILAEKYFFHDKRTTWPDTIKSMQDDNDHLGLTPSSNYMLAIRSFGACLWYLSKCVIDKQIMAMARFFHYEPPDKLQTSTHDDSQSSNIMAYNKNMILDSITLSNLKIIGENSLLTTLDNCSTKFGKRLMHHWLCSPSCEKNIINLRQEAIKELMEKNELLDSVRALMGSLPDLERLLTQIHTFGNNNRSKTHPDSRAILFEQKSYNKKKIQDFISTLNGFDALTAIPNIFANSKSKLLKDLTQLEPLGKFPNMTEILEYFKTGFDHEEALKEGIIAPGYGVDKEYDFTLNEIQSIEKQLAAYLEEQEKLFGCRINYFGNDRKRYQLEIPESNAKRANANYILEGQKKGSKPVKRFHTEETKSFLKQMQQAEDNRNSVLRDLSRRMFEKFSKHYILWKQCIDLASIIDNLCSFAVYGQSQTQICFPHIIDFGNKPVLDIENSFYPSINVTEDFIPNGISLGDDKSLFVLLTGPNMGGKSTLMRQMALLIIIAQMGCPIPAANCRMSLVDRVFTRLGAQDDIISGQSTFLVELNETSSILKHATVNSLVLLDELGRGTSTYDGTAIAAAVVNFLADVKCRTLFSTHYHNLVDKFQLDKRILFGHMACMVENEENNDPTQENVTFLYKYTNGPCPKSYGFNAAKLAGMPNSIIRRANELSKEVELRGWKSKLFAQAIINSKASSLIHMLNVKPTI